MYHGRIIYPVSVVLANIPVSLPHSFYGRQGTDKTNHQLRCVRNQVFFKQFMRIYAATSSFGGILPLFWFGTYSKTGMVSDATRQLRMCYNLT